MSGFNPTLDPKPVQVRRLEVLTGVGGRRRWSPDDKARIVEETLARGATVSDVARRHDIRPQQLFGWRRGMRICCATISLSASASIRMSGDGVCSGDGRA